MQITPPFGYQEVVPFLKTQKVRLLKAGEVPEFVRRGNAIPISHTEFQLVGREYPIVFASSDNGKNFAAVAVLGLAAAENLFCADSGWERNVYVPAYARRYPFCMARVTLDKVEQKNRLICIEKAALDEGGEAMFNAEGKASERWTQLERLLTEYEADLERSREMCALLSDYGLLEPFTMQATLAKEKGGGAINLSGMHRVVEKKLEDLNAAQLKNLMRKGLLARVYMHLLSLENFARLLERKSGRGVAENATSG
jgi:hypothetical protein